MDDKDYCRKRGGKRMKESGLEVIVEVALPCPLHKTFEYIAEVSDAHSDSCNAEALIGCRVSVNFARRKMIGVVTCVKSESEFPREKLKKISARLDSLPILSNELLQLALWIAHYYHAPIGEVLQLFLPAMLRQGKPLYEAQAVYRLTDAGQMWQADIANKSARAKWAIMHFIQPDKRYLESALLAEFPNFKSHRKALLEAGLLAEEMAEDSQLVPPQLPTRELPLVLTQAQQTVVDGIVTQNAGVSFIEGVTGSGKTAVYTEIARDFLAKGQQVLMLVPEIGLTPQFVSRIEKALGVRVGVIHSQITDRERLNAWRDALLGRVDLIIGTRSALFTPFARLGLIIVDEAHDGSYIQRDGVRYSAHNSAIKRANLAGVPLILGSATPTYESVRNIKEGRFSHYQLPARVSGAMPSWEIINCHEEKIYDGISDKVLDAIEATIGRNEQVLLFLNRRGFSPVLTCLDCGDMLECDHCSSYLNYHRTTGMLHCHHCATKYPYPERCNACGGSSFKELGAGTQKIEKSLADAFPLAKVLRFDRDNVKNSRDLEAHLTIIGDNEADIIIGTQMLAKGHDFPNITLVVLLNSDGLFFANDFRAEEKMAQLLMQVSGRAGRGEKRGTVMVQTMFPDNSLFHELPKIGYHAYAEKSLEVREILALPPYAYQILVQVEARSEAEANHYLEGLLGMLPPAEGLEITPVMPNNLKRRQGFYRVHAILQSEARAPLHRAAYHLRQLYDANIRAGIRLLIEVDPLDFS